MGDPLRDRRPPLDLAASQQVVEISDEIGSFARLAEVVAADLSALEAGNIPADWRKSKVTGRLEFAVLEGEDRIAALDLRLEAAVPATCQRCLQAFEWPLSTRMAVLLGGPGVPLAEHEDYEAWELDEDLVSPLDIVDEALVMAMPLSAMHEDAGDCVAMETADVAEKTTTPFAALRAQMDEASKD